MSAYFKKIELIANIAIIIVAVILGAVLVKRYLLTDGTRQSESAFKEVSVGAPVSLPGVDWSKNKKTLLLVLQKGCKYCTESAGFYKRIIKENSDQRSAKLIAVLPQEIDDGKKYLSELDVAVDDVKKATPTSLGTKGTPTLILVNDKGIATGVWFGQLIAEDEDKVINQLKDNSASR